jgi:hypothetical protein
MTFVKIKTRSWKENWLPGQKKNPKQYIETIIIPIKISTEKKTCVKLSFEEKNEKGRVFFSVVYPFIVLFNVLHIYASYNSLF